MFEVNNINTVGINDVVLLFLLLTLNILQTFPGTSIVDFEQVNVSWDRFTKNII